MPPITYCTGLRCVDCGTHHPLAYRLACSRCGGLLEAVYDLQDMARHPRDGRHYPGIWRWHFCLPVPDPACFVTLGEGHTPLLDCPRLAAAIGVGRLWIKFEGAQPTGTVKDRTSATAVAAARFFGYRAIGVVSTGNAGSSIASYGARAGLRTFIFCYPRGSQPKLNHMAACASDLIFYDGVYDDMIGIFDRLVEELPLFDGGATRNPFKHEGKKTIAYEVAEGLGWRSPPFFAVPVGVGEAFIAAWRGFQEMAAMGWTDGVPRMIAAQSDQANPIVRAWREGRPFVPGRAGYTVAEGVAVSNPGPKAERVLAILRESQGLASDVTDQEVLAMQRLLARAEGIWAGPTGCVSLAAVGKLAAAGALPPDAEVVAVVTETGLKGEYPPVNPRPLPADYDAIRQLVAGRLAGP